jgi:hypothetical protein
MKVIKYYHFPREENKEQPEENTQSKIFLFYF